MVKSYKTFIKEYSMGLQVPSTSYLKGVGSLKNLTKKEDAKEIYYNLDRGMAAWKGGHRPGTTPQQWAFARVNSFITKSPGTWGKADSDLAKKVRGS